MVAHGGGDDGVATYGCQDHRPPLWYVVIIRHALEGDRMKTAAGDPHGHRPHSSWLHCFQPLHDARDALCVVACRISPLFANLAAATAVARPTEVRPYTASRRDRVGGNRGTSLNQNAERTRVCDRVSMQPAQPLLLRDHHRRYPVHHRNCRSPWQPIGARRRC